MEIEPSDADRQRWQSAEAIPPVSEGEMEIYVLAVRRTDGKIYRFSADYLNKFPLPSKDGAGLLATGWYDHLPDATTGAIVSPLYLNEGDEIVKWCELPRYPG